MKVTVCKGCGSIMNATNKDGKSICLTCIGIEPESGVPVEVELPETVRCDTCGKVRKVSDVLEDYVTIPFFNAKDGTYYCGCRGFN